MGGAIEFAAHDSQRPCMKSVASLISDFSMLEYLREQEAQTMHKLNMAPFVSSLSHALISTECKPMQVSDEA